MTPTPDALLAIAFPGVADLAGEVLDPAAGLAGEEVWGWWGAGAWVLVPGAGAGFADACARIPELECRYAEACARGADTVAMADLRVAVVPDPPPPEAARRLARWRAAAPPREVVTAAEWPTAAFGVRVVGAPGGGGTD